jgi:hypothetical protein
MILFLYRTIQVRPAFKKWVVMKIFRNKNELDQNG